MTNFSNGYILSCSPWRRSSISRSIMQIRLQLSIHMPHKSFLLQKRVKHHTRKISEEKKTIFLRKTKITSKLEIHSQTLDNNLKHTQTSIMSIAHHFKCIIRSLNSQLSD